MARGASIVIDADTENTPCEDRGGSPWFSLVDMDDLGKTKERDGNLSLLIT